MFTISCPISLLHNYYVNVMRVSQLHDNTIKEKRLYYKLCMEGIKSTSVLNILASCSAAAASVVMKAICDQLQL